MYVDFNISFEDDRNMWNMWTMDVGNSSFRPYNRWSNDKIYSIESIISKFPKTGHHHLVIQACNPYITKEWSGANIRAIQEFWSSTMSNAVSDMMDIRHKFNQKSNFTRSALRKRRASPRSPDDSLTPDYEDEEDLWERPTIKDRWDNVATIVKGSKFDKNPKYEGITDIKYSNNNCLCKGPCTYQNACDWVNGFCKNTKKCPVDPDECSDNKFDYCE